MSPAKPVRRPRYPLTVRVVTLTFDPESCEIVRTEADRPARTPARGKEGRVCVEFLHPDGVNTYDVMFHILSGDPDSRQADVTAYYVDILQSPTLIPAWEACILADVTPNAEQVVRAAAYKAHLTVDPADVKARVDIEFRRFVDRLTQAAVDGELEKRLRASILGHVRQVVGDTLQRHIHVARLRVVDVATEWCVADLSGATPPLAALAAQSALHEAVRSFGDLMRWRSDVDVFFPPAFPQLIHAAVGAGLPSSAPRTGNPRVGVRQALRLYAADEAERERKLEAAQVANAVREPAGIPAGDYLKLGAS